MTRRAFVLAALVAMAACGGGESERPAAGPVEVAIAPAELPAGLDGRVERVVDGDTIVVAGIGDVRLIGIDTPETKDPRKPVQCFGERASAYADSLLPSGTEVRVVADVETTDRYGRALGYVYRIDDGLFVNAALLAEGYAQAYTVPPNLAHTEQFAALQREAREAGRGLWSACEPDELTPRPGGAADADTSTSSDGRCDPAYPDACIPSPPPDLDCADVGTHAFAVRPPDPHRFDADGNGVGCEGAG